MIFHFPCFFFFLAPWCRSYQLSIRIFFSSRHFIMARQARIPFLPLSPPLPFCAAVCCPSNISATDHILMRRGAHICVRPSPSFRFLSLSFLYLFALSFVRHAPLLFRTPSVASDVSSSPRALPFFDIPTPSLAARCWEARCNADVSRCWAMD